MTLSPLPWLSTSSVTAAPETRGAPIWSVSPLANRSTFETVTTSPTWASILGTLRVSPTVILCWNPPHSITEYMVVLYLYLLTDRGNRLSRVPEKQAHKFIKRNRNFKGKVLK